MPAIRISRAGRLRDEPETGHNRWHPDIEPKLSVNPGEVDLGDPRCRRWTDKTGDDRR